MAISTSSSKLPAFHSRSTKQHSNTKKHDSLPPLPVSPYQSGVSNRRHTPTSSTLSTPGTSRTRSRIPTPMTSRESSSSPPLKSSSLPSSSQPPPSTQSSKIEGTRRLLREKIKGKNTTASLAHGHMLPVLHISKSSFSLISDTGEGYDFGLSIGRNINHTSSQCPDDDKLDRVIEEKCKPLLKELARVTQDLHDLKARVGTLEANSMDMQEAGVQPRSVAEPQTARQKEKSPQKGFQPLIYATTSDVEKRNDTQEASSDVQDTTLELRDENDKLKNEKRELEEKLRAYRSANVDLINGQEETKAENEQFQPSAQQCEANQMDLDQKASGPSNPPTSGQNGDSSSQKEVSPSQQVSFEMIQRLSQEQEPFENAPDPDDIVTEVHTNKQTSEAPVQHTGAGNNPLIETDLAQRGPIITQQDILLAQVFCGPSVAVHNTAEARSHDVSRLREEGIVRVQSRRARRDYHRDMSMHEEQALQTRSHRRRRRRPHRSSDEQRYPDDPIRSRRSHRRHRCRPEWERGRGYRQREDRHGKRPFIMRFWPSSEHMFFPDKYRRG